ncbi:L-glutamine synthetase [Candidatus Koribacter versatilis Ellin345]|uniref:L-glutamine synthetase n=1 Tax=Koribacter versatilis (strain Ellin345) TaxID=204669 RepID=Q1IVC9_KORVE|nr:glutamine synthetase family protein [Candidatus Koribacter versatilis]ABF39171.1 L-glutamine synthetase [Candidatus Koribacter versatilis Ellin345]
MATITHPYALSNPMSLLTDKPREEFTRADLLDVIEQKEIERITFHYTALDGKYKELKVPVANRRQAERILADGERVDGSSLFRDMVDVNLSDLYVVPVYKSAFLNPFGEPSLELTCRYLNVRGEMVDFAPDAILHNAAELFRRSTGCELWALGELEFFLLSDAGPSLFRLPMQRGYHASGPFVKSGAVLDEIVRLLTQITGAVKYAHNEVGCIDAVRSDLEEIRGKSAEQLEVEFLPAPVEDAGDFLVLARWLIRNVAYRHNCVATFTPKIEEGVAGNGLHVHMEVRRDGRNIMRDRGELSAEARQVIGGLCTYADSLTAFGNTVSSAYLRLVPNQEAPTRVCWSDLNRSTMIRVPLGWSEVGDLSRRINSQQLEESVNEDGRQTVELRSPDGSAFAHLLLAGITMAAEWGMTHEQSLQIAADLYTKGNIFHDETVLSRLRSLPRSCVESARILSEKRDFYERDGIFPASMIEYMAKLLRAEDDEGMNRKLIDLPADDRLHETRKIMHKDLHRH